MARGRRATKAPRTRRSATKCLSEDAVLRLRFEVDGILRELIAATSQAALDGRMPDVGEFTGRILAAVEGATSAKGERSHQTLRSRRGQ
jgi:hypothetical protein